jgi:hypothetical protein
MDNSTVPLPDIGSARFVALHLHESRHSSASPERQRRMLAAISL